MKQVTRHPLRLAAVLLLPLATVALWPAPPAAADKAPELPLVEKVTHKGRFYEVNDHAIGLKPVRDGGPPIWFAGTADAAIKRAARLGDAWMIVPSTPMAGLTAQMRVYRAALGSRTPD